ncbi:hypothetical protein RTBOTA2_001087 [Rhodotorula toruloides]|nr:hypothetical protein RTBOTA2_001087 [Rhodotorula toruloides]
MDKLVQRYAKSPVTSAYSSRRYAQEDIASEEYGYALPLGRGIERCPAPNFEMPATVDPTSFLQLHTDDASDPSCRININHGTTTLAFKFQVGIVVAVDSRATTGSYIADCQYWETYLGIQSRLHELRNHKRISVTATSEDLGCWHNNLGDLTYRPAAGGRRGAMGFLRALPRGGTSRIFTVDAPFASATRAIIPLVAFGRRPCSLAVFFSDDARLA